MAVGAACGKRRVAPGARDGAKRVSCLFTQRRASGDPGCEAYETVTRYVVCVSRNDLCRARPDARRRGAGRLVWGRLGHGHRDGPARHDRSAPARCGEMGQHQGRPNLRDRHGAQDRLALVHRGRPRRVQQLPDQGHDADQGREDPRHVRGRVGRRHPARRAPAHRRRGERAAQPAARRRARQGVVADGRGRRLGHGLHRGLRQAQAADKGQGGGEHRARRGARSPGQGGRGRRPPTGRGDALAGRHDHGERPRPAKRDAARQGVRR